MSRRIAALLLVYALGGAVHADRERAAALVAAGQKSLAAKDWPQALAQFQAAAKEEPELLAAHRGWAEAALASGEKAEALRVLHGAVLQGEARKTLPKDDVEPLMAMRKKLAELDPASAQVEALLRKHGDAQAALALKYMKKDPVFAETSCHAALAVVPDHGPAQDRLARLRKAKEGKRVSLFNGRSFDGWLWAEAGRWDVKDGLIVSNQMTGAMLIRTTQRFEGDFDFVVDVQVKQRAPSHIPCYFALLAAFEGDYEHLFYGVITNGIQVGNYAGQSKDQLLWNSPVKALTPPLDVEQWNTYEFQFSGASLRVAVNGTVLQTVPRPENRRGGYLGLKAQGGIFHFRKLEVVPR